MAITRKEHSQYNQIKGKHKTKETNKNVEDL